MRMNTQIYLAIRNVGDSQDDGTTLGGPLKDVLSQLIQHLTRVSIAKRIVIGIGRTEQDAQIAIRVERAGKSRVDDGMRDLLSQIMNLEDSDEPDDDSPDSVSAVRSTDAPLRDARDDWEG